MRSVFDAIGMVADFAWLDCQSGGDGEGTLVHIAELLEVVLMDGGEEGVLVGQEEEVVVGRGWGAVEEVFEGGSVDAVFEAVGFEGEGGGVDYFGHDGNHSVLDLECLISL